MPRNNTLVFITIHVGYEERIKPILISLKTKYPSVKLIELKSDKEIAGVKNILATLK